MAAGDEPIRLEGEIALDGLEALRDALLERIAPGATLTVESRGLASAPFPLVQLLYAAHRLAAERGASLAVDAPQDGALGAALAELGFAAAPTGAARVEGGVWRGLSLTGALQR